MKSFFSFQNYKIIATIPRTNYIIINLIKMVLEKFQMNIYILYKFTMEKINLWNL